jgi:hypothetical protein
MGIFKKIFKKVGKVFKGIGKTIKKGFQKFGKFMNKLGILGQIGMMFIMPGIANFAMKGLMQLGSGFMTGLANAAATSGGLIGGVAKVTHAVLSTVAKVAQTGMNAFRTITDTVMGVVTDTAATIGQKMGLKVAVPNISAVTGLPMDAAAQGAANAGSILQNAANRFQAGTAKTWASLTDTAKVVGDIMPGGADYIPKYENIGKVSKEINYSTKNMDAFKGAKEASSAAKYGIEKTQANTDGFEATAGSTFETASPTEPYDFETYDFEAGEFDPTVQTDATAPISEGLLSRTTDAAKDAFSFKNATASTVSNQLMGLTNPQAGTDYSRALSAEAHNDYLAESIGPGAPLYGSGSLSSALNNESIDFLSNALNTEPYLANMPFTQNMYEEYMQKSSINGGQGQFAGRFTA